MFGKHSNTGYVETLDGVKIKTVVYGEKSLMAEFLLSANSTLPDHSHIHEQTGYLVKGKIKLHIENESRILQPGDSWCVPANARHRAEIIEDSVAIEIFTPCRDEYKEYANPEDMM